MVFAVGVQPERTEIGRSRVFDSVHPLSSNGGGWKGGVSVLN